MSSTKIVKRKAKGFFKETDLLVIKEAVQTCHDIMTNASILVRSYYLKLFQENHPIDDDTKILELTKEHLSIASSIIQGATTLSTRKTSSEDKRNSKNLIFNDMLHTFKDMHSRLPGNHIINSNFSLSHILQYSMDGLLTCYHKNINMHFKRYPKRYITCDLISKNYEKKEAKRIAWNIVRFHFYDHQIEDETSTSLIQNYEFLFPKKQTVDKPRCWDICKHPWMYLYKMVMINQSLENDFMNVDETHRKLFNPLPFYSSFVPMHIRFDTSGIAQLLMTKERIKEFKDLYELENTVSLNMSTKKDMLSSFKKLFGREPKSKEEEGLYATSLWAFITNLKTCKHWKEINKVYKNVSWVFDNAVITDGVSVSIQIANDETFGRKVFGTKRKVVEVVNVVDEEYFKVTKKHKILGCDPGKRDILAITDGFKTIRYTKGQRDQDTFLKVRQNVTLSKKRNCNLETYETQVMNRYSKRSCNPLTFHRYVCIRKKKEVELSNLYGNPVFREFKFTCHVKTKSSEDRFKDKVIKTFSSTNMNTEGCCIDPCMLSNAIKGVSTSKDIVIGWGNWGKTPNVVKGVGPTPGIGIRKRFSSIFRTVTVNENMTSKTCPCCENMTLKIHNKHHLLRCTNEDCKSRWWNRNVVGSFNILKRYLKSLYPETETSGNGL